jgi:hypothetical protein
VTVDSDDITRDAAAALFAAADAIAAESVEQREAIRKFVRGDTVRWKSGDDDGVAEFMQGYQQGVAWLRSGPPMVEAESIAEMYLATRPGGPKDESTFHLDADTHPHLLAHNPGEYFEVESGAELADQYRRCGDPGTEWNLPARTFSWPALHRWFEGFGQAVFHCVGD